MSDVTARFQSAFTRGASSPDEIKQLLRGRKILFVRGFLSEAVVKIGESIRALPLDELADLPAAQLPPWVRELLRPKPPELGQYFDSQTKWLGDLDVSFECADIESEAPVSENGKKIAKYLVGSEPITVITHSKGCLDTLDALLQMNEPWKTVKGWIAIQGPFYGAPVADFVAGHAALRKTAQRLLEAVGGKLEGLTDMQTETRKEYHRKNNAAIKTLVQNIPTLCLATSVPAERLLTTFLGAPLLITLLKYRQENDGLVPATSAALKGAWTVTLEGVDHAMPVMRSIGSYDRVLCTEVLLSLLAAM